MRHRHRASLLLLLPCLAACGPSAQDGEEMRFRSGGDLLATGDVIQVPGIVESDVMVAGREVTFSGDAGGSVLAAGSTQAIGGSIGANLHAVGGGMVVTARVARNVTLVGADVRLAPDAEVTLNAYLVGGHVEQLGAVRGHLRVAAREVVLDGHVTGNVDIIATRLTVGPSARIEGDLTYRVREGEASIDPTAQVEGETLGLVAPAPSTAFRVMLAAGRVAAFLLVGVVLLLVVPPLAGTAERLSQRPGAALGLGLLWIVAIPVMTFAAAVTVIGIPLAVIATVSYLIALYVAPVVPGVWLGVSLLDRPGGKQTHPALAFLLGGAIVAGILLVPWIGFPLRVLASSAGFGAVAVAIRARIDSA